MIGSPKTVLLDLDGTLIDSAPGIISAFQTALTELGQDVPAAKDLTWIVGPPLRKNMAAFVQDELQITAGIKAFRDAYSAGTIFDAAPYEGIFTCLELLKADGFDLFVCTAKPEIYALQIIDKFGFTGIFKGVYGSGLNGDFEDKAELIAHILAAESLDLERTVMVGDRANDTVSAQTNKMASIGVLWGFGSHDELLEGGAHVLCAEPSQLVHTIRSLI